MKFGELKEKLEKNLKEMCAEMYKEDLSPREWDVKLSQLEGIVRAVKLLNEVIIRKEDVDWRTK